MPHVEAPRTIELRGEVVEYTVVESQAAGRRRIRVGPDGVVVVQPASRDRGEAAAFLTEHAEWVLEQVHSAKRRRPIRRTPGVQGAILLRGRSTPVRIAAGGPRLGGNVVSLTGGEIIIHRGIRALPVNVTLERWLREQARSDIQTAVVRVGDRIGAHPERIYVMSQRTKWGNCSRRRNLSFNWRLVMAPEYVLRYLVTHETVHLAIPDHSAKFWLTVQSLCPETARARQWLVRHQAQLRVDLATVVATRKS